MRVVHSPPTQKAAPSSVARSDKHHGTHGTVSPSAISSGKRRAGDEFLRHPQVAGGGCFPQPHSAPDISALVSLWGLDHAQGPINGDQMAAAIETGVGDKDGQAASGEFQMFADWASRNQGRLSPEARQVMDVYAKYARSAQARGMKGIPEGEFQQMVKEMRGVNDASVTAALAELDRAQGPVNGDQMAEAIRKGVADLDGKAATDEFKQFADWAKKNEGRLSPEARQVLGIYEKYAKAAQAQGQSGIPDGEFRKMTQEMNAVRDAGASRELFRLSMTPGRIGGLQMLHAIRRGVGDLDGKSATDEYQLFADWAKANTGKLSPAAQEVLGIYEKYAKAAQAQGQSGIALTDYRQMLREMIHAARPPMAFLARAIAG